MPLLRLEGLDLEPSWTVLANSERQIHLEELRGVVSGEPSRDGSPPPPGARGGRARRGFLPMGVCIWRWSPSDSRYDFR